MALPMPINVFSNRGQGVCLVLHALRELGGVCTKQEVLHKVQTAEFYEITHHDLPPYENQNEPRYHTLIAWARKDALLRDWLIDTGERDSWQLSRDGRELLDRTFTRFRSGEWKVSECYLWTTKFKKIVDPNYQPSSRDRIRPEDILENLS